LIQRIGRVLRKKEKHSHIYEVFCKETIEEKYSIERQSFFMDLASSYRHFIFEDEEKFKGEICQA
jgi:superfamily II DNA or RNA helicase